MKIAVENPTASKFIGWRHKILFLRQHTEAYSTTTITTMKGTNGLEEAFSDTSSASIVTYNHHQDNALKLTVKEGGKHNQAPHSTVWAPRTRACRAFLTIFCCSIVLVLCDLWWPHGQDEKQIRIVQLHEILDAASGRPSYGKLLDRLNFFLNRENDDSWALKLCY
jgi:hypothetical protein